MSNTANPKGESKKLGASIWIGRIDKEKEIVAAIMNAVTGIDDGASVLIFPDNPSILPTESEPDVDIVKLKEENEMLKKLLGRDPNTKYTYYQIELKNINDEWDITICESLEEVHKQLTYLDIHLDDDTELPDGEKREVVITGVGMTPIAYYNWYKEYIEKQF